MSATFDATTTAAYNAATTAAARAAAIVAALTGTISVKVFNGSNVEMGTGTMAAPWATASAGVVTLGEVASFTVGTTATPAANWYIRFQTADASRWARGSFGLAGSGQDYTWSLDTWEAGQTGTIGAATIVAHGNAAPEFTVAPATASLPAGGGTVQFTAIDPDGGGVLYTLPATRAGITIDAATGLVTVTSAANGSSGEITVAASDGILTTTTACTLTVAASALLRFAPGHYFRPGLGDSLSSIVNKISTYDTRTRGLHAMRYWNLVETSKNVFNWSWHDSIMDACEAAGKTVVFSIQDRRFGGTGAPQAVVPAYIINEGLSFSHQRGTGSWLAGCTLWRQAGMTYCIDVYKRLVDRYGHRSAFVGYRGEESIYGNPTGSTMTATYPDYNATAYMAQEVRRTQELRAYAPHIPWSLYTNFVQADTASHGALQTWFSACRATNGVWLNGGPDVGPLRSEGTNTDGEEVMLGIVGGVNHLGTYLINQSSEQEEFEANATVQQIYQIAVTQRGAQMVSWATNPSDPNTPDEYDHWSEEVYPYLATHPTSSTIPSSLIGQVEVI